MPLFLQIDQMARGGSIALFLLWSWILLRDHRGLAEAQRLTIRESLASVRLHLWDEQHQKLMSFREERRLSRLV